MAESALKPYKEDFFLILEAGFIAVNSADEDSAIKLFRACQVLKPESTFPKVGLGYMHLCKLEIKQAIKLFEEVVAIEPTNDMAQAFLGICMSMNPAQITKGEKLLEEMIAKAGDEDVKKLADMALEFVDQFVKKAPSPMEPQKPGAKAKSKPKT